MLVLYPCGNLSPSELRIAWQENGFPVQFYGIDFPCVPSNHWKSMEDITKATFAFSKLTEINSKRSARYTAAAGKVKNIHLKIVFMNYAFQAQQLNADLRRWIMAYGVQTIQNSDSMFSAAWERVKDLFNFNTENGVFSACEQLEEEALKNYRTALILSFLPEAAIRDVERQFKEIQKIKDNLRNMKQSHVYELQAA